MSTFDVPAIAPAVNAATDSGKASCFMYGAHVHANGIRQHFLRFGGRGRALIVLPGITSPAITWSFVGERLGRFFDTYALDLRGRGLSEAGSQLDYSLDTHAADVAAFLERMGIRDGVVVGHSFGARVAIRMSRYPSSAISALVLADPPVSGPGRRRYPKSLDFYLDAIAQARLGTIDIDSLRQTYPKWSDEQIRLRCEWLHTCDPAAVAAAHRGFHDDDIHTDLDRLRLPTLLLAAARGGVIEESDVEMLRSYEPIVRVSVVRDSGHMIPFDQLDAFIEEIDRFCGPGATRAGQ